MFQSLYSDSFFPWSCHEGIKPADVTESQSLFGGIHKYIQCYSSLDFLRSLHASLGGYISSGLFSQLNYSPSSLLQLPNHGFQIAEVYRYRGTSRRRSSFWWVFKRHRACRHLHAGESLVGYGTFFLRYEQFTPCSPNRSTLALCPESGASMIPMFRSTPTETRFGISKCWTLEL